MKKSLAVFLLTSTMILSACGSNEISEPLFVPTDNVVQTQSAKAKTPDKYGIDKMSEAQIQKLVNDNKKEIEKVSQIIYMQHYADESVVEGYTSKNAFVNPAFNGGLIFNLLNRSDFAKKLVYGIGSYAVKKKFSKPDIADNFPVVNADQTEELLSVLKPGDIILCGIDDSFIHSIVYAGNGIIVHALGSPNPKFWGVIKEPLKTYFARSTRDKFVVLRYKNATPEDISKEISYASQQVGKGYDSLFLLNDDGKFYCTELVFRALMNMSNPPKVLPHKEKFGWELIDNTDFMDSPDLETVWTLNRSRETIGKLHTYK